MIRVAVCGACGGGDGDARDDGLWRWWRRWLLIWPLSGTLQICSSQCVILQYCLLGQQQLASWLFVAFLPQCQLATAISIINTALTTRHSLCRLCGFQYFINEFALAKMHASLSKHGRHYKYQHDDHRHHHHHSIRMIRQSAHL